MKYLGIIFFLVVASISLMAQTAIAPLVGNGTLDSPYEIATMENLYWIAASNIIVPDPDQATRWSSHYIQTDNIDASETFFWFSGQGWNPIGNSTTAFTGSYKGENFFISGLYINRSDTDYIGLFGITQGAYLQQIKLQELDITGYDYVGGLVGLTELMTLIESCSITGWSVLNGHSRIGGLTGGSYDTTIIDSHNGGNISGNETVGGLIGELQQFSSVDNCINHGQVYCLSYGVSGGFGGLIGEQWNSNVYRSFSIGSVYGYDYGSCGGLIGEQHDSTIYDSYSTGYVNGGMYAGGLVGWNNYSYIYSSYSIGFVSGNNITGGLVGGNIGSTIFSSYWNIETSDQTISSGGEGRTTDEMTYPSAANTYVNWDFLTIWKVDINYYVNDGYPYIELRDIIYPPPATAIYPGDSADNIPILMTFEWVPDIQDPEDPSPDGYLFGYCLAGNDILYFDVGSDTTYPAILNYETEYEWQVIPYFIITYENYLYAQNCPLWTFTTEDIIPLVADFSADLIEGLEPLTVQFNDLSEPTDYIISWLWDFGDGETSEEQNPEHTYQSSGIYAVSLTVTDVLDSTSILVRDDYITVFQLEPEISLLSDGSIYFEPIYLGEQSEYEQIIIDNSGVIDLTIIDIHFIDDPLHFEFYYEEPRNIIVLEPEEGFTIYVRFTPQGENLLNDILYIVNDSSNEPLLGVNLSGIGVGYHPPKSPGNMMIELDGYDAIITWDPVTENIYDQPIDVDYYFVYFNGSGIDTYPFYFLARSFDTQHIHYDVVLGADYMFYMIKAIVLYEPPVVRDGYRAYVEGFLEENLKEGMTEVEVKEVLNKLLY